MPFSVSPRKRRLAIAAVLLLGTAAVAWRFTFPDPATASIGGLRRWLVLRDLSHQSEATQLALVDRLQLLLLSESSVGSITQASPDQLQRLGDNIDLLSRVWFMARARQYQDLESHQRMAFLSQQLEAVLAWGEMDDQIQQQLRDAADAPAAASTLRLLDQIDLWIQQEPPVRREHLEHTREDAVLCWLATSDLEEYDILVRRAVVERMALALEGGSGDAADRLPLDDTQQLQLLDSAWILMEAWFLNRADEFHQTPIDRRAQFFEDQLDKVASWRLDRILAPANAGEAVLPESELLTVVTQLLAQIPDWIERAPPEERDKIQHLADELKFALANELLKRALPRMLDDSLPLP